MKKIYKNKRGGADTIIAALLLIGIAIAGSFIVYRTLFTSASNITNKPLIFVSDASLITFQSNAALLQLTIQNQGNSIVNLTGINIYNKNGDMVFQTNNSTSISPGGQISIQQRVVNTSTSIRSGEKYLIILKFVIGANQNTTVSVNVIAQ